MGVVGLISIDRVTTSMEYEYASQHDLAPEVMEAAILGEPNADGWIYFRRDGEGTNWFRRLTSEPSYRTIYGVTRDYKGHRND